MSVDATMQQRLADMERKWLEKLVGETNHIRLEGFRDEAAMLIVMRALLEELSLEQRASISDRASDAAQSRSGDLKAKVAEVLGNLGI
ncbi:hypothetical protein JYP51_09585 [Ponticoccus gilvus]|nr:hypothetical protein [Enemella evansiae]